jgi:hypothetical protein
MDPLRVAYLSFCTRTSGANATFWSWARLTQSEKLGALSEASELRFGAGQARLELLSGK